MANYISSNSNRFYVSPEASYGQASPVTSQNRFPAVRLAAQQVLEQAVRHDKTGSRTFLGSSRSARRHTAFEARTYLTSWSGTSAPGYGPLFQAAMGGTPQLSTGLQVKAWQSAVQLQTTAVHGLSIGSGVAYGGDLRFVTATPDTVTVVLNAPFSSTVSVNSTLSPALTYYLSSALPSVTLYDYWASGNTVSRIISGAAVDTFKFSVNGDFHEFAFNGPAADLVDSSSFTNGSAGLSSFPVEPALAAFDYSIVPGHLGQVWLGTPTNQFFTLTGAHIELKNHLETRNREFGSSYPRAIVAGMREVTSEFKLLAQDNTQTAGLYQAAKQRVPIPAMLQLGQQQGQIMGVFMPAMTPEIPNFDDGEVRLQWDFKNNRAQGVTDNEIFIAFA